MCLNDLIKFSLSTAHSQRQLNSWKQGVMFRRKRNWIRLNCTFINVRATLNLLMTLRHATWKGHTKVVERKTALPEAFFNRNVLETLPHRLSVLISGLSLPFKTIQAMITRSDFGPRVRRVRQSQMRHSHDSYCTESSRCAVYCVVAFCFQVAPIGCKKSEAMQCLVGGWVARRRLCWQNVVAIFGQRYFTSIL